MFVGRQARNLDRKSRLALPAEYVNRLQPEDRTELYVTPGKKGCIWLVPKSYWDTEFERLADEYESAVPGEFYHHCRLRPVDKAGRVLLERETRELAGLSDPAGDDVVEVMVCGSGRYLQIWDKSTYEDLARTPRDFARSLPVGSQRPAGTE